MPGISLGRPRMTGSILNDAGGYALPPAHSGIGRLRMPRLVNIVAHAKIARGMPLDGGDLVDIEHDLDLDPVQVLKRHFRVYMLPGVIASGVLTFTPQRPCIPFVLHIPSGSAGTKTITSLENGVRQYFATSDAVPATMYTEKTPGLARWLRPLLSKVGNTITAQTTVANGTFTGLACFDMADDGLLSQPYGRLVNIGWNAGAMAAAATATVKLAPQKVVRPRRIEFDSTVTNWDAQVDATHGIAVTNITVANDPQFEANGTLPCTMFDYAAPGGGWNFDGDPCAVGATMNIALTNNEASNSITPVGAVAFDSIGADDFEP